MPTHCGHDAAARLERSVSTRPWAACRDRPGLRGSGIMVGSHRWKNRCSSSHATPACSRATTRTATPVDNFPALPTPVDDTPSPYLVRYPRHEPPSGLSVPMAPHSAKIGV